MTPDTLEIVKRIVEKIEQREATYHDGLITFPAYMFELLHNNLWPNSQKHEYTEREP